MAIIVEDLTEQPAKNLFDEKYIIDYTSLAMPFIVEDAVALGLSPKEIVYSVSLIAENLKRYSIMTSNTTEEDFKELGDWTQKISDVWMEKVKSSGLIEKVKDALSKLKAEKPKGS